ncbi:MAG: HDIG protein [uncultured bacterium]|nr:MAG: HDIG protein [uncultured bacterium]HBR79423.1 hypothetical protein [Candidatus Moranbacteria bacterium]
MGIESMPQNQEQTAIHYPGENYEFSLSLAENCSDNALDVIREKKFIRERLLDIKNHDEETFLHSLEVGNMTAFLINKLGDKLAKKEKEILISSALLHDYGKTSVDPEILNKREELTPKELMEIEKHPTATFHALREWNIEVAKVSVAHHEHQDHTYPRKEFTDYVMGERIPSEEVDKLSRILAIVDSFQAMSDPTRPSSIRNPKTINEIIDELNKKFILREDKEIIFLLEEYYYEKLNNEEKKNSKEQIH